ncbi:MAG: GTPase Era [Treponema sp.]|jgi:GTP-binding protein Era|nr:GTPase Era [Treponema sp.]
MNDKKSAFVTIIGRPSAGKSTLLNKMCGEKVAIVSVMPQTTRSAVRGIVNSGRGQLVFVDTPGRHNSLKKFNKKLLEVSERSLLETDLALYVLDASRAPGAEEKETASLIAPAAGRTVIAVNKTDLPGADKNRAEEFIQREIPDFDSRRIFGTSALTGLGVGEMLGALYDLAPSGDMHYGAEYYTDQESGFRIAEIIREQAINRLRQELPHSLYVEIADSEFSGGRLSLRAFIVVERESQKGMVVGKGGRLIREIRIASLKELNRIFDWKIELDLRVKTGRNWRSNDDIIRKITGR